MTMMKTLSLSIIVFVHVVTLANHSLQQQLGSTTTTCNFTTCSALRIPCSTNPDCECFSWTVKPSTGICASAFVPCTSLVRCNTDYKTCSVDNTVCVNSTRCGKPVCYPLALANKQVCPASPAVTPKTTVKTTPATTTPRAGNSTNATKEITKITTTTLQALNNSTQPASTSTSTLPALVNYIGKTVYLQSIDSSTRYLAVDSLNGSVSLLPFSSATILFTVRQCIWQSLQETQPNCTCITLESANGGSTKNLRHYKSRAYMHSLDTLNQDESKYFIGDSSFLLIGDATGFLLSNVAVMQLNLTVCMEYSNSTYEVYARLTADSSAFQYFKFVPQ